MTLVGKIMTFLIFLLSVVFMSFSVMVYSTHRNWRDMVERPKDVAAKTGQPLGLKIQLAEATTREQELRAERDRLQKRLDFERAARKNALAHLYSRVDLLAGELKKARDNYESSEALLAQAQTDLKTITEQNKVLAAENEQLVKDIASAQDKLTEEVRLVAQLTEKRNELERGKIDLNETATQLTNRIIRMRKVLTDAGLTEFEPATDLPPELDGVVRNTVVSSGTRYVELSFGGDDGIRVGHEIYIYRNDKYLGRAVVRDTSPDRSVAEVVKEVGTVRQGDRVYTKTT